MEPNFGYGLDWQPGDDDEDDGVSLPPGLVHPRDLPASGSAVYTQMIPFDVYGDPNSIAVIPTIMSRN